MKINFVLAAETYMYLPLFLAEEKKIFESVFKEKRIECEIAFIKNCDGDQDAITEMLKRNKNVCEIKSDEISVAICDPTSILRRQEGFDNKTDIRVVGKLINKLPFWIISSYKDDFKENSYNSFRDITNLTARKIYTPNGAYITADTYGHLIETNCNLNRKQVDFSDEISKCIEDNSSLALTGDLNLMAKSKVEQQISIVCHMANNNDESVATAIVTSRYVCEKYKDIIALMLEAIQKAIFIIYSSPEIAIEVCNKISDNIDQHKMTTEADQKKKTEIIIQTIDEDHLYPMNIDFSFEDWKKTVDFYLSNGKTIFDQMNDRHYPTRPNENNAYVMSLYQKMFFKDASYLASRAIIEKFGVSCKNFEKEIPYHMTKKVCNKVKKFIKRGVWFLLCFLLFVAIIIYIWHQIFYNTLDTTSILNIGGLVIGALSLIWGVLSTLNVFPSSKPHDWDYD